MADDRNPNQDDVDRTNEEDIVGRPDEDDEEFEDIDEVDESEEDLEA